MKNKLAIRTAAWAAIVAAPFSIVPAAGPFQVRRATTAQAVQASPPLATITTSPFDAEPLAAGGASYYYGVYDQSGAAMNISVLAIPASHSMRVGFDDGNPTSAPVSASMSSVTVAPAIIRADGLQLAVITIVPRDANNVLLGRGLALSLDAAMLWPARLSGSIVDLGDGSYSATVVSSVPGTGSVHVAAEGIGLAVSPSITVTPVDTAASSRDIAIAELRGLAGNAGSLSTLLSNAGQNTPQAFTVAGAMVVVNVAVLALANGDPSHDDLVVKYGIGTALAQLATLQATPGTLNPLDVKDAMSDLAGMARTLAQSHVDQATTSCGTCNGSGTPHNVCDAMAAMANGDALAAAVSPNWTAITDAYALAIQKSVAASLSC